MISSMSAAKQICENLDWEVSNLSMQKMLYVAQMVSLGRSDGARPLINASFEAWNYGPVLPSVYHSAKVFGSEFVGNIFHSVNLPPDGADKEMIQKTTDSLREKTPGELVAITHWEKGAWAKHYQPRQRNIKIPNADILDEYRQRTK